MAKMFVAVKVIHRRPSRCLLVVVDGGEVDEKIEAQFRLGELADLGNSRGVQQFQRQLTAKLHRAGDDPLELLLERFGQLLRGHSGLR